MADHVDYAARWCEDTFDSEFEVLGIPKLDWPKVVNRMFEVLDARGYDVTRRY